MASKGISTLLIRQGSGGTGRGAPLPRRGRRIALGATGLLAAQLAAGALAPAACGGDGDSTTGKRVTLATRITAAGEATGPFTNAFGWSITLSMAALSIGALYYFAGEPLTARLDRPDRSSPRFFERLARWAIPAAHAHPGHYDAGEAKGEMLEATSVDLAAGPADLAPAAGISGVYRSARLTFGSPPAGPLAAALEGHVVVVEGRAHKGADERLFRASADVADVLDSEGEPSVEGCVFEEVDVQEDGTVTALVKPSVWLDQVDFEEVPPGAGGEPVELDPEGAPHRAFARGLMKGTAYVFSYAGG